MPASGGRVPLFASASLWDSRNLNQEFEMTHRASWRMSLPVQIVEAKGVNESIFLGIPHNGGRVEEEEEAGMNREGDRVSPQRRSTCGRRCSLLCSLSVRRSDCHMVKIWAKWGEHLGRSAGRSPSSGFTPLPLFGNNPAPSSP